MESKSLKFLSRMTLWTNLRAVGNRPLSRLVILIPLLGYWIIFNKNLQGYVELKWDKFFQPTGDEVPWKLLSSYFGLCFIAVATFLYEIFCPEPTKLYSSAVEHSSARYQFMSDMEFSAIEETLKNQNLLDRDFKEIYDYDFEVENKEKVIREVKLVVLNTYFCSINASLFLIREKISAYME